MPQLYPLYLCDLDRVALDQDERVCLWGFVAADDAADAWMRIEGAARMWEPTGLTLVVDFPRLAA